MSMQFTPNQQLAIENHDSTILVSAAAGSGKTRVLTEHLLHRVCEKDSPVDIDRFLVITYTRAAASELRSRIMDALTVLVSDNPTDARLRHQQALSYRASFGTIHSFCTSILREYSHVLGLSPTFSVLDEDRATQIKTVVISRLLDQHYEKVEEDPNFRLLSDTVGAGRDDRVLQNTLLRLHEKLRSHPYPQEWARSQKAALLATGLNDIGQTAWGQELMSEARVTATYWISALEAAITEMKNTDDGGKISSAYGTRFQSVVTALRKMLSEMNQGWDQAQLYSAIPFNSLGRLVKYSDQALKNRMNGLWNNCKKSCSKLSEIFAQDSVSLLHDLRMTAPAMNALLDLTMEFDSAYQTEKLRRCVLDFSDLEHYAVQLLVDKDTGSPSQIAHELSLRYEEIMVDEYQDVNAVQEMIFHAVSRNNANLFLVGDVKQSIYRFRLADPGLFLEKYRSFASPENAVPGQARRILLQENFRSRRPILDATNLIMSSIMSVDLGELNYDADASLKYGAQGYDPSLDVPVEFHIIDTGTQPESEEESPEAATMEAHFVASKILELVRSGAPVTEAGISRPCNWGDFVLLMRSAGGKAKEFRRVLSEAGIPVESPQGGGFFSSLEISVMIDLLSVIDNPHADVPLVNTLRSPIFGFSVDELSDIRTADRNSDFYTALCSSADNGNTHCQEFCNRLNIWRRRAPEIELDEFIWDLCSETEMFAICSAMGDGALRRQNLMRLFELARNFEEGGYRGLYRFIQWINNMAENGKEPDLSPTGHTVKIMTVHKSKGLEFPFVFLCNLAQKFNKDDFKERVLIHSTLGLGPKVIDTSRGIQYPTVAFRAIKQRLTNELLSEEMRILYVAMTRAKERLFLSCAWSKAQNKLDKLVPLIQTPLPPEILKNASGFAVWVALAALSFPKQLPIIVHEASTAETYIPSAPVFPPDFAKAQAQLSQIKTRLSFEYPWSGSVDLPSKLTATELKDALSDIDPDSYLPIESEDFSFPLPKFGDASAISGAIRGTVTHTFLQFVNLQKTGSVSMLQEEADRLASIGLLQSEEVSAIDFNAIYRFFISGIGKRLRAAQDPRREFRFLLLADAEHYFSGATPEDQLLLQGVVDCCFEEDGGITILDYKTDNISEFLVPQRAERYRVQLHTYAEALKRIFRLPVKHCILWFLHPGVEYEVEL